MFGYRSLVKINLSTTELRSMKPKKVESNTEYAIKIELWMWKDSPVAYVAGPFF